MGQVHAHGARRSSKAFLLPLWEKVSGGARRMRGRAGVGDLPAPSICSTTRRPLIRRFAPPSPARGEGTPLELLDLGGLPTGFLAKPGEDQPGAKISASRNEHGNPRHEHESVLARIETDSEHRLGPASGEHGEHGDGERRQQQDNPDCELHLGRPYSAAFARTASGPNTRAKIVSMWAKCQAGSNSSASSASERWGRISGSAFSTSMNWPPLRQICIALRCTAA